MLKTIQCFKSRVLPMTCIPLFSACITNTSFKCNYQCCCYFSIKNGHFRYSNSVSNNTHVIQYSILLGENGSKCNMPKRSRPKSKKHHSSTKTTPKKKSKVTKQSKKLDKTYSSRLLQLENSDRQANDEACSNNSDELCVVYDFKEEKKNRVYEVITLSGDSDVDDSDDIVFLGCFKSEPAKNVEEIFLSSDSDHEISADIGTLITKFERGSLKTEVQSDDVDEEVCSQMSEVNYEKEIQELDTIPDHISINPEMVTNVLQPTSNVENDFESETLCYDVKTSGLEEIYSHLLENSNIINEETQISNNKTSDIEVKKIVQPKNLKELCFRALCGTDIEEDKEKAESFRTASSAECVGDKESCSIITEDHNHSTDNVAVVEECNLRKEVSEDGKCNYSDFSNSCKIQEEANFYEQSCETDYLNVSTDSEPLPVEIESDVTHEHSELQLQPEGQLEDSNSNGATALLNQKETCVEGSVQSDQETSVSDSDGELEIIDVINHSVESTSNECDFGSITSSEYDEDSSDYEEFTGNHKWKEWRDTQIKTECRYEEITDLGKVMKTDGFVGKHKEFKVMSYNVLSQYLLYEHLRLYSKHDQDALDWKRRRRLILNEITAEQPDILCLQEVEEEHIPTFYNRLELIGYNSIYKQRTGDHVDGCAIYFKPNVFKLEEESTVEFRQPGVRVLDRDNVGIVLKLRVADSPDNYIVVATTHLLYNPRRQDVKLAQVQVLLAEIERLAYNSKTNSYYPIILTGDFNLTPGTGVYKLITEGRLKYEGMSYKTLTPSEDYTTMTKQLLPCRLGITDSCQHVDILDERAKAGGRGRVKLYHSEKKRSRRYLNENDSHCENDGRFYTGELSHNLNFNSVYQHETKDGKKEATTYHTEWITVDYIFYSLVKNSDNELVEGDLHLISKLRLPSQEECEDKIRYLPNFTFGSDHLSLVAKFVLNLH